MTPATFAVALVPTLFAGYVALSLWRANQRYKRAAFIREYRWPPGLLDKLAAHRKGFTRKETALVSQGLRQFFLAYLESGRKYVAMPSQAADDLWHEFILYTREYQEFCKRAFGGMLHHTPAVALAPERKATNEGLRRVWWQCCKQETIDPVKPTRLPLLFALDTKLKIANGFVYTPDCEDLRRSGVAGTQCGGDFASGGVDGSTAGFGDSSSDSGGGSGGDGGGSDGGGGDGGGGGCGGGGD